MLVSIITINYNDKAGLKRTIQSVQEQTAGNYEHIVIDGNSSDGSVEVIRFYESGISYWVSEADTGIYNAMNKGIKAAKGAYFLFLNSGDTFYDKTSLEQSIPYLKSNEDLIYGDIMLRFKDVENDQIRTYPAVLNFSYFFRSSICHQATYMKSNLFEDYGWYNEENKIVSDWEYFLKVLFLHNVSYKKMDFVHSVFYKDGISSDATNLLMITEERERVLKSHFPRFYEDYNKALKDKQLVDRIRGKFNSTFYKLIRRPLFLKFLNRSIKFFNFFYKIYDLRK